MGQFRSAEQWRRTNNRVLKYKSGTQGSKLCACGRTISQTAEKCLTCANKPAQEPATETSA